MAGNHNSSPDNSFKDEETHGEDPPRLGTRARLGALWSIGSSLLLRLTSIFVTAVVARILDPHDFGVFAVALTAYTIVSSLGELGVSSCLIRADLDIDSLAPTMASVSLITSVILAATMLAFAPEIGAALGSSAAAGPIRVMAIAVILVGIFAVPNAQLIRDFKQDKLFLANAISFVPSTIVLLLLAKSGTGAMAFAWSRVVGQFITGCVLVSSVSRMYRPGIARSALSILFKFGLPLAAANFVNYILINVDYALIGRLLGAIALGTYVLAFNVASWPNSLLGPMINNVSMPAFSRVKGNADEMREAIGSAVRALSTVILPMCGLMIALARPLVLTLYGERWTESANVLPILAIYGAISMFCLLFANILASLGRTKFLLTLQLIWLFALVPAMALGVREDSIVGAAYAHIAIILPIVLPCYIYVLRKVAAVRVASLVRACLPALLASLAAMLAARITASQFASPLIALATGLAAGGLVYIVAVAPLAIPLFGGQYAAKPPARDVLRFYHSVGRLMGLQIGTPPKHAVKRAARMAKRSAKTVRVDYSDTLIGDTWESQQKAGLIAPQALGRVEKLSTGQEPNRDLTVIHQKTGTHRRLD